MRKVVFAILLISMASNLCAEPPYPWTRAQPGDGSLAERIQPPSGFTRIPALETSFTSWLRGLPLRPAGTVVRLFDGTEKPSQSGAFAVVDIDIGSRDLRQCADAVIRLRAEYLFTRGCADRIVFDFTSGDAARWSRWSAGWRPVVSGNNVSWIHQRDPDSSYRSFRDYLNTVFIYAGSYSLSRQLEVVPDPTAVLPGDVFIQAGFPGHAVLVADVAENPEGRRVFLLLQSYMPAQDIHVLTNPADPASPWYPALKDGTLGTPEWTFSYCDLRRFPERDCQAGENDGVLPNNENQRTGHSPPRQ